MNAKLVVGDEIVVASHNVGKVREIAELLTPYGIKTVSAGDLSLVESEETGLTFKANAELKAVAACRASGLIALADDSGLEVEALDGEPGIYSARWAGESKDFSVAMERVEKELQERKAIEAAQRTANFICDLCLAWPDGQIKHYEGRVFGTLVWPPRGSFGFGYDPVFLPDGLKETFGELDPAIKHNMSHRAAAFNLLVADCFNSP